MSTTLTTMSTKTILIIEDETSLVEVLDYNLNKEGYEVVTANDGRDGLEKARAIRPDLILLDLMLPTVDGLQICRQLRSDPRTRQIAILMLTAKAEENDEVVGFDMGADDYVTKPFKVRPLLQRVRALLRRGSTGEEEEQDVIEAHGVEVDRVQHSVRAGDRELDLTPTEFRLLLTLMKQPGRVFSRFDLMDSSRGQDANALERTIDVHVRSLRKKLGDYAECVQTVRGVGYRFRRM